MKKFKKWLWERFLPEYARQSLMEENTKLQIQLTRQANQIMQLNSYIEGLERGLRALQRVTIRNTYRGKGE